ncbi:MAG: hypothetical protein KA340_14690, partial [Saprospiraceae bacterium]|nr:hypothetical protein [Saprospiraceae bacterium]
SLWAIKKLPPGPKLSVTTRCIRESIFELNDCAGNVDKQPENAQNKSRYRRGPKKILLFIPIIRKSEGAGYNREGLKTTW